MRFIFTKVIYNLLVRQGAVNVRRFILVPFYIYYRKTNRNYSPYLLFKGDIYLFRL